MRGLYCRPTGHGLNTYRWTAFTGDHKVSHVRVVVKHPCTRSLNVSHTLRKDDAPTIQQLRPYQEESIQAVLDYLGQGGQRAGLSLATGSGKTVIFSHLIDHIPSPRPNATQTLILAHRRELVEQAAKQCRRLYPQQRVDVEMGAQRGSGLADITVASEASMGSGDRLMRYDPERFKLIIVDEAHHIVGPRYMGILRHFGLVDEKPNTHTALVGVSATLSRLDGVSLAAAIDRIVYHKDYIDMIDDEWLAKLLFTTVRTGVDLSKVKSSLGDFMAGALSKAVNNPETNTITVRTWLARAEQRRSTLVFCVDTTHLADLTTTFRQHGVDARFVTGDTAPKVRAERLQAFKTGGFPVLLNVGVFTEGTDIPNIDCVLLARPTKSRNLLVQMIGRGLRKHPGKENCHVIDMVASLKSGIVTTPTLFGLDADELVTEIDSTKMKSLRERREKEKAREEEVSSANVGLVSHQPSLMGKVIFTDYDDVNDLIEDATGERHIRALSKFAWVMVGEYRYILSSAAGDLILRKAEANERESMPVKREPLPVKPLNFWGWISPIPPEATRNNDASSNAPAQIIEYIAVYNQRLPNASNNSFTTATSTNSKSSAPFMRSRTVATAPTFESIVNAADTFASEKFPFVSISKNATWRQVPATQAQLDFLNRSRDEEHKFELGDITKGKAGDLITKLKHGAKAMFGKYAAAKRKLGEEKRKKDVEAERSRSREVKVGPVRKSPVVKGNIT